MFLDFEKKRKNVKKTYGKVHRPLNYRKSVPVSHGHQHQTSYLEVWRQETMQLKIVCDKRICTHKIWEF